MDGVGLEMLTDDFVSEYADILYDASDAIYEARERLFTESFTGYADDTLYRPATDEYMFWPVQRDDGFFVGYFDPCDREKEIVDGLVEQYGFEYLGSGRTRLTLAGPTSYNELVVKIGRCGTDLQNGEGRPQNMIEHRYTEEHGNEAPIIPCLYCSLHGEFAVFPRVDATFEERPPEDDNIPDQLRQSIVDTIPRYEKDDPIQHENIGWWSGEPVVIDYVEIDPNSPIGVPEHVDGEAVINQVQTLRRRGEKKDLPRKGTGLIEPDVAGD